MNFAEKLAMKVLERGMRNQDKRDRAHGAPGGEAIDSEIVPAQDLSPEAMQRMHAELVYYQRLAAQRGAELAELQKIETLGNIEAHHREKMIRQYLGAIESLNLSTPGGVRSQPLAEEGEDQDLVNEAWNRFCLQRRGGASRFG